MNKSEVEDALAVVLSRAYRYEHGLSSDDFMPHASLEERDKKIVECEQILRQALLGQGAMMVLT